MHLCKRGAIPSKHLGRRENGAAGEHSSQFLQRGEQIFQIFCSCYQPPLNGGLQREKDTRYDIGMRPPLSCMFVLLCTSLRAQSVDWPQVNAELLKHYQELLRLDTTDPPGNETKAVN